MASTLLILSVAGTVIALVLVRPRGWHEAWWTCAGAAILLLSRVVDLRRAMAIAASSVDALLFLLGLLFLAALVERSGFFGWAALGCARMAKGNGHALYRNVFLLGALVTAVLSLDSTAVMLTPIVLALVTTLRVPVRPYVFACAFVANTGSLLLPMSNLTNLLVLHGLGVSFGAFALRMVAPQLLVLAANYAAFRLWFRAELPVRYDARALPDPTTAVRDPSFFRSSCAVVALVCVGSFIASAARLPPAWIALGGAGLLAGIGIAKARIGLAWLREVPLGVFPFVLGLFVIVAGVDQLGLVDRMGTWLPRGSPALAALTVAGGSAVLSNLMNNLPAALLVSRALRAAPSALWYVLAGTNVGPCSTTFGSLATLLVLTRARASGFEVRARDLLWVGLAVTPLLLLVAWGGLAMRL